MCIRDSTIIAKNDNPPANTPVYNFIATGNNADDTPQGSHPQIRISSYTGTLDANGNRPAGGTGISASLWLGAHARVEIDGRSEDLGFFSNQDSTSSRGDTPRLVTNGSIIGGIANAGRPYTLTVISRRGDPHAAPNATTLITDYLGTETTGQLAQFEIVSYEATLHGGTGVVGTGYDLIEHRGAATLGIADNFVVAAEMWSEGYNEWRLTDFVRRDFLNGTVGRGIAFVLKGGDTAEQV